MQHESFTANQHCSSGKRICTHVIGEDLDNVGNEMDKHNAQIAHPSLIFKKIFLFTRSIFHLKQEKSMVSGVKYCLFFPFISTSANTTLNKRHFAPQLKN